jgi:hypothetical protein
MKFNTYLNILRKHLTGKLRFYCNLTRITGTVRGDGFTFFIISNYYYYYQCLTAVVLTPGGSSTVNTHKQYTERNTQSNKKKGKCGPRPVFASYTLAFSLQLRKKHGKSSVRVVEKCTDIPVAVVSTHLHTNSTQNTKRQNTQNGTSIIRQRTRNISDKIL